jgi:hypothetical protein
MRPGLRTIALTGGVVLGGWLGLGAGEAKAQVFVSTPNFALGVGTPVVGAYPVAPIVPAYGLYPAYPLAYPVRPYPYAYGRPGFYGPRPYYHGYRGYRGYRRW